MDGGDLGAGFEEVHVRLGGFPFLWHEIIVAGLAAVDLSPVDLAMEQGIGGLVGKFPIPPCLPCLVICFALVGVGLVPFVFRQSELDPGEGDFLKVLFFSAGGDISA